MNVAFERVKNYKDEWLTPPDILYALGEFDLDPCAAVARPWDTAKKHYTVEHDGLAQQWEGRVWCNPPYGKETGKWLERMAEHGNGIALIFSRTETSTFFRYIWPKAHGIMFLRGRLAFYHLSGTRARYGAGAPSCLVAYGEENGTVLQNSGLGGAFIWLKKKVAR